MSHQGNATQNHRRHHIIPSRVAVIKGGEIISVGKDVEKLESSDIAGGNVNGAASVENSLVFPQTLNIALPYDPTIPLVGIYPKELTTGTQTGVGTAIYIASLFAKVETTQGAISRRVNKIHTRNIVQP